MGDNAELVINHGQRSEKANVKEVDFTVKEQQEQQGNQPQPQQQNEQSQSEQSQPHDEQPQPQNEQQQAVNGKEGEAEVNDDLAGVVDYPLPTIEVGEMSPPSPPPIKPEVSEKSTVNVNSKTNANPAANISPEDVSKQA